MEWPAVVAFMVAIAFGSLACSWFGVIAFHSDSLSSRTRFFAERGIAPSRVWWTRQAVPLACLAIVGLVLSVGLIGDSRLAYSIVLSDIVTGGTWTLFVLLYSLSQWSSMIVRHSVLAGVATPFFAGGLILYLLQWSLNGGDIQWCIALWILLPMMATRLTTRYWMDGVYSLRYWVLQAGLLPVLLVLPFCSLIPKFLEPAMPAQVRGPLLAEASKMLTENSPPQEMGVMHLYDFLRKRQQQALQANASPSEKQLDSVVPNKSKDTILEFDDYVKNVRSTVERKLEDDRLILRPDANLFRLYVAEATLQRLGDNAIEYRDSIELLDRLSIRSRQSTILRDQDKCDVLDLWLLRECRKENAQVDLGSDLFLRLVERIADRQSRNEARRRAVMTSWARFENRSEQGTRFQRLGGIEIVASDSREYFPGWLERKRGSHIAYELLECLDEANRMLDLPESVESHEGDWEGVRTRVDRALPKTDDHLRSIGTTLQRAVDEIENFAFSESFVPPVALRAMVPTMGSRSHPPKRKSELDMKQKEWPAGLRRDVVATCSTVIALASDRGCDSNRDLGHRQFGKLVVARVSTIDRLSKTDR